MRAAATDLHLAAIGGRACLIDAAAGMHKKLHMQLDRACAVSSSRRVLGVLFFRCANLKQEGERTDVKAELASGRRVAAYLDDSQWMVVLDLCVAVLAQIVVVACIAMVTKALRDIRLACRAAVDEPWCVRVVQVV